MDDEDKYRRYANIPIPSYDEAVSRPSSSQNLRGPQEVSDDAERQGLLGQNQAAPPPSSTYRPPTAESERSSVGSDLQLPEVGGHSGGGDNDDDDDRRHIEELDYLDPSASDPSQRQQPGLYHRARLRSKFAQRLSNLGATLSSLRLPSFRSFYSPVAADTETANADAPSPSHTTWFARFRLRLPTIPAQYRISAPNAARLCGLLILVLLVYFLLIMDVFPGGRRTMGQSYDPESVRMFMQEGIDANRIQDYLQHITSYDHVAGTEGDFFLAEWMRERWAEDGHFDQVGLGSYYVYLNYPTAEGRSVAIVAPPGSEWTARLDEDTIDPQRAQTLAWHGYSKSGEAEGHLVYANGGSSDDFAWLRAQGVELQGSVALVRAYHTQEDAALKVRAAQDAGCVAVLIFVDPADNGSPLGQVWPNGRWRPDDSLQRDSVGLTSWVMGDPLTPGWASKKDSRVIDPSATPALPKIPSAPLAWRDAKVLLESLLDHGVKLPQSWVGGDVNFTKEWWSGMSVAADGNAPVVHVRNLNDENDKQQIWNVHGSFQGMESFEQRVIVGSHHDAWCFGAANPGSGTAVMMELVNIFGQLRSHDWSPRRTIEFVSWDAAEYNKVGSSEYVEENVDFLRNNAIAYLNVDTAVGVIGSEFRASGSPVWERPLLHVLDRVADPVTNTSVRQSWDQIAGSLQGLGTDGDYVAFQDMAGIPSIDFGFNGNPHGSPMHSCYDTFDWMITWGDPEFRYSRALAQIWALLILEIADRPIIPFDVRAYADRIQGPWLQGLQDFANAQFEKSSDQNHVRDLHATGFSLDPLRKAAAELAVRAEDFHHFEDLWTANVLANGGFESTKWAVSRFKYNDAVTRFDTRLLDLPVAADDKEDHGLPSNPQFRHVIFGPQTGSGSDTEFFPFVREAVAHGDWELAQKMVEKTAEILRRATEGLTIE